ncbi:lipopolysaccharide transport periplasmic protein LptA [Frigidibacter sp.]|uniref:lipopolysaccharide transport periplasmic protein LptA n=1 Tax=Frigidibacter sp. TaxID=2586418 RepID=UPI0027363441|nr:lipopolysaccharide transport periplasmic protein LptA [Frigidibacter sp.]MDP3339097.1 lipopolysaccharide transport periplasmic protein LptA [Frigidibacter sp.]
MALTLRLTLASLALAAALPALGQGTNLTVSGLQQDTGAPVEVTADSLQVDQAAGSAVFTGNVLIVQGTMRLAAAEVRVTYATDPAGATDTTTIDSMTATGGVTLATATEAAEAAEAVYSPQSGELVMTGDVLLIQGGNSIAGQLLTIDLNSGASRMDGRVKTVLQGGGGLMGGGN